MLLGISGEHQGQHSVSCHIAGSTEGILMAKIASSAQKSTMVPICSSGKTTAAINTIAALPSSPHKALFSHR